MTTDRRSYGAALVAGILFGLGLGISGMTLPTKVIGFLDFFGNWDPSLMWVMGGAVVAYAIGYPLITKRKAPIFDAKFRLPTKKELDPRLITGSAIFGLGWGLGGFCPGPALTGMSAFMPDVFLFVGSMLAGMALFRVFDSWLSRRTQKREAPSSGAQLTHP